ncbi:MAG: ATP-dependent Clp protease adaptor ClpS [Planctomycetia bacterium]
MTATATATAEEGVEVAPAPAPSSGTSARKADSRPKKQPRYHVVLWNDDDHTYQYVIAMLQKLFGHPPEKGYLLAKEVDVQGRVIVLTTTKEHAELKRDQIHAFGADRLLARSKGAMSASIEPEPE